MNSLVDLFFQLVKIDSPSGFESEVSLFISDWFRNQGLKPEIDRSGNLFVDIPGRNPPLILSAHMDTVEPGRGIRPRITDEIIQSGGDTILGADNKGALAAIMQSIAECPPQKNRHLEVVFSVREETDSGIGSFDFSRLESREGLIPDLGADLGYLVTASPWIMNLELEIIGKPAHASLPESAINALTVAARAISAAKWGRLNPDTVANLGLISGGTAMNTVPGRVKMVGEIRSFSQKHLTVAQDKILAGFSKITKASQAVLEFNSALYCRGYEFRPDDPSVTSIINVMKHQKLNVVPEKIYGASDSNVFAAHGFRVITIGDGCQNPHTVNERISITALNQLKDLILAYITRA